MKVVLAYPRIAAGLVAGIIIGLFASGVAYAVTSNVFRYSATQTGWLGIDEAALSPGTNTLTFSRNYTNGGLSSGPGCYQTGVSLPNGARVTALTAWYSSLDPASQTFYLFRRNNNSTVGAYIVNGENADTGGAPASIAFPVSGSAAVVDNRAFSYGFAVCFNGGSAGFFSARITYTYRTAGG